MKRKLLVTVIVLAATLLLATPYNRVAHADGVWVIQGNDDSDCSDGDCDSKTLQDALDAANPGAKLILRGTFDFGENGSVSIFRDVEIVGESATIKNGKQTFAIGFDPSLPDGGEARSQNGFVGPKVVFKDLHFEDALYSTIHVIATSGLTVKNCSFEDGKYYNYWGPLGAHHSVFIHAGWTIFSPYSGEPSDVTGPIIIKNNTWEGNSRIDYLDGSLPFFGGDPVPMNGILSPFMMIGGKDVYVTINNNVSKNAGWYHFTVVDIKGNESSIEVLNNTVENDNSNVAQNSILLMSDMHAWTSDIYPGLSEIEPGDPDVSLIVQENSAKLYGETRNATSGAVIGSINNASITNNKFDIATEGYGCGGRGIWMQGVRDSVINNNLIILNDICNKNWSFGIAVWEGLSQSSGNMIENNKITGAANYGIVVGDSYAFYGLTTNNVFRNNNLKHLILVEFEEKIDGRTYTEAHILFDLQSAGNVFYGNKDERLIDFGTDNEYQYK